MLKIQPSVLIGIGYRAQRTVQACMRRVHNEHGTVAAILPVVIEYLPYESGAADSPDDIHHLTLSPPQFSDGEWPDWLLPELEDLTSLRREHTRAWMRAAFLQNADDFQEFLVDSIPRLFSLTTVETLHAQGLALDGESEVGIYLVVDMNEPLGSGILIDVAYMINYVCAQLGLTPLTMGLLYLPSSTSPAPAEEAIAYAALKELEHYASGNIYNGEFLPDMAPARKQAPLAAGCYLVDTVNELGYTLSDEGQQVAAVSEWIYAMIFLGMAESVRERRNRRYQTATLRNRSRIYNSFGVTIRYVPQKPLVEWISTRIGSEILEQLMSTSAQADVDKRVRAFMEHMGLSVDVLQSRLYHQGVPDISSETQALRRTPFNRVELRARQSLNVLRQKHLPTLQYNLNQLVDTAQSEIEQTVDSACRIILEDVTVGGLATTHRFLKLLDDHILVQQKQVKELSKEHRTELRRSLETVSTAYYTLRSATMSTPSWPILLFSVLAALVFPLVVGFQLSMQVIRPLSQTMGTIGLSILIGGVLAVLEFVLFRRVRQTRTVGDQHTRMVQERFEIESTPLLHRAMSEIYDSARETISGAQDRLDALRKEMETVRQRLEFEQEQNLGELIELATPGLSRSIISPERAESLYRKIAPDIDTLVTRLVRQAGPIAYWQSKSTQAGHPLDVWLQEQIIRLGQKQVEKSVQTQNVLDFLSHTEVTQALEQMFDSAKPLWNYDPKWLRRAKTQRLTLIGEHVNGAFPSPMEKAYPQAVRVDTGDPHSLIALQVHIGMPLFALRRLSEYRVHYAEMLRHSKLPPHSTRDLALVDDLFPMYSRTKFSTATLFAVALALGIIHLDADGGYHAPKDKQTFVRLSTDKRRAVALMGMNYAACREITRRLEALIASKGPRAVHLILDEYTTVVPDLEPWEVRGILDFDRAYKLEKKAAQ